MQARVAITTLMTIFPGFAQAASPLADLAWQNRPVLVFASSTDDHRVQLQLDALRINRRELFEREMLVITVIGDAVAEDWTPSDRSASALREAYDVSEGEFSVVLIGKDTGVKRRESGYIEPSALFRLVDSMPMRRQEMRRTGNN